MRLEWWVEGDRKTETEMGGIREEKYSESGRRWRLTARDRGEW